MFRKIVKIIALACGVCGVTVVKPISFENVEEGVWYSHIKRINPDPLSIHVIKVDPEKVAIEIAHALGEGLNREKVASIAKRKNAICATNAGHYRRGGEFNGNSLGFLKIDEKIYSDPQLPRGGVGFKGSNVFVDSIRIDWLLSRNGENYRVDRVNQPLGYGEAIVYASGSESGLGLGERPVSDAIVVLPRM
ncbi:hypothetical protein KAT92_01900 [Candidatus Babeliales bacterium]|nr:hypothetical protein [Candidatus Babeliales bacterium]